MPGGESPWHSGGEVESDITRMDDNGASATNDTVLRVSGVSRRFRGLLALTGYELELRQGEILGVIGPNGAGKTTLFNVITGFLRPTTGRIEMRGQDITRLRPDQVARRGIARTFQTIRLFGKLSVIDNVKIAQQLHGKAGFLETLVSAPSFYRKERELERRAMRHLDDLGLADLYAYPAAGLPYGSQRKVEIARALALEPTVVLLDEPAAGMNAYETTELLGFIRRIHTQYGLSIVVVEHDMSLIMRLCDRIQVLNYGRTICEGSPERVRSDPAVIEAYLGGMLRIDNLSVYYGGIQALKDVSLHLETGELLAIIGANGAGKTTLLRTLSGVLKARSGSIRFEGKELTRLSPFDIVALGIAHSPEGRQLFGGLTVLENLKLGAVQRTDRAAIEQDLARTFELFPVLKERRLQRAGTLSGGEQQMLAIGRALMARPRLLLLDEPSLGLAPLLVERIFGVIARLKAERVTLLLVEQNARMALNVADRAYVMETGRIKLRGTAAELAANPEVERAYLGG